MPEGLHTPFVAEEDGIIVVTVKPQNSGRTFGGSQIPYKKGDTVNAYIILVEEDEIQIPPPED